MLSFEEEKRLFEDALCVAMETALLGYGTMDPPPAHADRCWVHSCSNHVSKEAPLREYWIRLQCYALNGRPSTAVLLWGPFARVPIGNRDHPMVDFYDRVTSTGQYACF